jgi:hypothetical protein
MAATDVTTDRIEGGDETVVAVAAAAQAVGPLRNPDDCVLACPDCTCRMLLEQRRGSCEREGES